jgi:hypothetical protein
MAVYKVPQDVEAEDKLLGPFSFKQFIFLIIAIMGIGMAYALSQIVLPLALLPLPITIFFGILALPLRKDQPMEVYLAAVISFITKPKRRLWQPDGIESLIEVIAPKVDERQYGKGYNQEEVQRRLSYLANLVDSHGWSVRGVADPNSSMRDDLYNEALAANDMLDEDNTTARQINTLVNQADLKRRQDMVQKMQQSPETIQPSTEQMTAPYSPVPLPIADPYQRTVAPEPTTAPRPVPAPAPASMPISPTPQPLSPPQPIDDTLLEPTQPLTINPYPNMRQSVISPLSERPAHPTAQPQPAPQPQTPPPSPAPASSPTAVSPAIMDLANNHSDLSIETLQREADRLEKKAKHMDEEVVISLH